MKISVTLKPGMIVARGNDFIKLIKENGEHCFIVHCYDINKVYTGASYVTDKEIEKYININGLLFADNVDFQ